jgi:hypothetical protein
MATLSGKSGQPLLPFANEEAGPGISRKILGEI